MYKYIVSDDTIDDPEYETEEAESSFSGFYGDEDKKHLLAEKIIQAIWDYEDFMKSVPDSDTTSEDADLLRALKNTVNDIMDIYDI